MKYYHVDVFSSKPMSGNGLAVVFPDREIDSETLLNITGEFRQFETVFIYPGEDGCFPLRIFTVDEELEFAGHPVLGAAAVLHKAFYSEFRNQNVSVKIKERNLSVVSEGKDGLFSVTMNQGYPDYLNTVDEKYYHQIAESLNLSVSDIDHAFPLEVVSTGLPYLLVPLKSGIEKCGIKVSDFEKQLKQFSAKFVYVFDTGSLECRTWDNSGIFEDVATGSAAGPLCAWLIKHGVKKANEKIYLSQGRFLNRPSVIECWSDSGEVFIKGDVSFFGEGELY